MSDVEAIKSRIRAYFHPDHFTRVEIARRARLSSEAVVRRMHEADWNPTTLTLDALDRAIPHDWRLGDRIEGDKTPFFRSENSTEASVSEAPAKMTV